MFTAGKVPVQKTRHVGVGSRDPPSLPAVSLRVETLQVALLKPPSFPHERFSRGSHCAQYLSQSFATHLRLRGWGTEANSTARPLPS